MWRSFRVPRDDDARFISLPCFVEAHADRFRERYLAWVYAMGETTIGGRRVVDRLELRTGFSYWWMTALAQRFNASGISPVHDAIKLLALEEWNADSGCRNLRLHSENDALACVLAEYCSQTGIRFERTRGIRSRRVAALSVWRKTAPLAVQSFVALVRHVTSRRTKDRSRRIPLAATADVTFVDVLVHLTATSANRFGSAYWTELIPQLERVGLRSNWLHLYFKHSAVPTYADAERLTRTFNANAAGQQSHTLIDSEIDAKSIVRALSDYLRLVRESWRLRSIRHCFRPAGSKMNLWGLFRREWFESLRGPNSIVHCLTLATIEGVLARAPRQRLGVYIQENQPWEMALIHVWKSAGHGPLIGVPHSTVRYWDLRYFYDPRSYERSRANALPMPDRVAVNGSVAQETYVAGGYPSQQVVETEALRYLHLIKNTRDRATSRDTSRSLVVLICGDFLPAMSHRMLDWLAVAARSLPRDTRLVFKPHPAYPIDLTGYSLALEPTSAPLGDVLPSADVVFASNITSSVVDAYCFGVPVVQMLDGEAFNMSPLRRMAGVRYVTTADELAGALLASRGAANPTVEYFHLDRNLPRWLKLLGAASGTAT